MTLSEKVADQVPESGDFNAYVGAASGLLKGLSLNPNSNLCKNFTSNLNSIDKSQHEITCMTWVHNTEQDQILVGSRNGTFRTFSVSDKKYCDSLKYIDGQATDKMVGIASYQDSILTAAESGTVKIWRKNDMSSSKESPMDDWFNSFDPIEKEVMNSGKKLKNDIFENQEKKEKHITSMKIGRQLCRMRQSIVNRNIIATGGKENDLQIWDLNDLQNPVTTFLAKNVKPDKLQLRVPVWVSDMCYSDPLSSDFISTVSKYGHIRLYDVRSGQRRPVIDLNWTDEALTAISATPSKDQVLVASGSGKIALYDFRVTHRGMYRKYKGCVGGIREIDCLQNKPYFGTVSLDRFLRIYNLNKQTPIQKMYLKSQLNCILLTKDFDPCESLLEENNKQQEAAKADKQKSDVIVKNTTEEIQEDGDEFWTKLKIIKSGEKSKGKKKSSSNIQTNRPVKKKRHE